MPARIAQIAFCLVLGSVSIAPAQINYDLPVSIQLASIEVRSPVAPASRYVTVGDFTNQHVTIPSLPAPKGDPEAGLHYSLPPSELSQASTLNQPVLPSRVSLADLVQTTSLQGWRIGDGGILGYRTPDRRWRFVFRYTPDFHSILQDFDRLESFSLVWQLSIGKHKPAN